MRFRRLAALAVAIVALCVSADAASEPAFEVPDTVPPGAGKVLVLGSGGFLGQYLTQQLARDGYDVIGVTGRGHVDLRNPAALPAFLNSRPDAWASTDSAAASVSPASPPRALNMSFCFFLACEVGGSKFIDSTAADTQQAILRHNVQIYDAVFPWLRRTAVPFMFISSVLQTEPTPYGTVKRLGESWVNTFPPLPSLLALQQQQQQQQQQQSSDPSASVPAESAALAQVKPQQGKSVRLWNLYGRERVGRKSHVLVDWALQCLERGAVAALTDGREQRQFLHGQDAAAALALLMRRFAVADEVTDLTSAVTVTLREDVAPALAAAVAVTTETATATATASSGSKLCEFAFSDRLAVARASPPPRLARSALYGALGWVPTVTFADGLADLVAAVARALAGSNKRDGDSGGAGGGAGSGRGEVVEMELPLGDDRVAQRGRAEAAAAIRQGIAAELEQQQTEAKQQQQQQDQQEQHVKRKIRLHSEL